MLPVLGGFLTSEGAVVASAFAGAYGIGKVLGPRIAEAANREHERRQAERASQIVARNEFLQGMARTKAMAMRKIAVRAARRAMRTGRVGKRVRVQGVDAYPIRFSGLIPNNSRFGAAFHQEAKVLDFYNSNVLCSAVPSVGNNTLVCINSVSAGNDYNTRVGRQILINKIGLNFICGPATGAFQDSQPSADSIRTLRVMLVCDKQANGSTIGITDVLEQGSTAALSAVTHNKLDNRFRFDILYNKVFRWGKWNITNGNNPSVPIFKKVNIKVPVVTTFSSTSAGAGNIKTCSLWLMFFTNETNGGTSPDVTMTYECRVRFRDA